MKSFYISFFIIFSVNSVQVYSQQLDLFQTTEPNRQEETTSRRDRPSRENTNNSEPTFVLVGSSRFGDKYVVSLLSKDNKKITMEWTPGKIEAIDGYLNYGLADVGSRKATIRYPDAESCFSNPKRGVICNGNMAVLTLSNAEPIESSILNEPKKLVEEFANPFELISNDTFDENSETIPGTNVLRRNPLSGELQTLPDLSPDEIAARERRRAERAEQFRDFEIVRIPDDEIPDGMRRVRTPFGDSLEPIED